MDKNSKIYIAGHTGIAGSALLSYLKENGFSNLLVRRHSELDLCDSKAVDTFFSLEQPEFVFFAAANPCGVANSCYRADFIYQNIMMQSNVIHSSYQYGVKKLLYYSSGYVYPKDALIPISEEQLLNGQLEYFCEPYAIAKIAGMKMCEAYNIQYGTNFIPVILGNLFGNNGSFEFEKARVMHALIRKMHLGKLLLLNAVDQILHDLNLKDFSEAKQYLKRVGVTDDYVEIWGTGKSKREFLHSYDMADASCFIMNNVNFSDLYDYDNEHIVNTHINLGTGQPITIMELSELIKKVVGYSGELYFNTEKPDSKIDRIMNCLKLKKLGWQSKISLEDGIKRMYYWYLRSK